jgi:hypothetical protein
MQRTIISCPYRHPVMPDPKREAHQRICSANPDLTGGPPLHQVLLDLRCGAGFPSLGGFGLLCRGPDDDDLLDPSFRPECAAHSFQASVAGAESLLGLDVGSLALIGI